LAISKEKKEQILGELKEMLANSKATIMSDYRGLTAGQMAEVRNKLRPFDGKFMVAKNTLVLKGLEQLGMPQPEDMLQGPTALSFLFADISQPLRAFVDHARTMDVLTIKGGLLGDRVMTASDVLLLSQLPDTDTVRAFALAGVQSPVSAFVGVLDAALRGLLYVLDAQAEQLGKAAA
jgi:large subunit ribosomal protein L10